MSLTSLVAGKDRRISLRLRFVFSFILLVLLMTAAGTYLFTLRQWETQKKLVDVRMQRLTENIATILSVEADESIYQNYMDNQIMLSPDMVYIAVFDQAGFLRVHALNPDWVELESPEELSAGQKADIVWRLDRRQIDEASLRDLASKSVNIVVGNRNQGMVRVGFSMVDLNNAMTKSLVQNLQMGLLFVVLAVIIALILSRKILTPLSELNAAMMRILRGDLDQRVDIRSRDEIGDMAKTFNFMAQGLRHKAGIEQFNRKLGLAMDPAGLAGMITTQITDALQSPCGFLFLKERTDTEDLSCTASRTFKGKKVTLSCSPELKDFLLKNPAPRTLPSPESLPPGLANFTSRMKIRAKAVITPIHVLDDIIGFFLLDARRDGSGYSETEHLFLNTLISQAGFVIENALLLEERTEKERLKREFEIARRVQQNLLPSGQPDMAGLDVDGFCLPAAEIGGDYYDFFRLDKSRIGIVIADVTGKGTSAAFYMAVIKGLMVSLVHMHVSPETVLREINRRLWDWMDRRIFITMGYAIFDTERGRCEFGRAGHTGLLVRRGGDGGVDCFAPPGIGLGLEAGRIFEKTIVRQDIPLAAGDVLILYTDGISETMNAANREFGEKRLMAVLKNSMGLDAKGIRQSIVKAVNRHRGKAAQHDDITLVTVRVTEQIRKAVAKAG